MKKFFITLGISALVISACMPQDIQIPQSPLLSTLERKSGLIAYIGLDGNIYVSDQGGGNLKSLTDDATIPETQTAPFHIYQIPTWSPDGKQLAFVGISGEGTERVSELFVADIEGENNPIKVYSGENETPFYLYWTPDNASVSFLSSTTSGRSMILQSVPAAGGERFIWDTGAPYYWSWAPDGQTMVVHAGDGTTSSAERMAFLQADSGVLEDGLELHPAAFQAPAWSPDGSQILLAAKDEDENSVIVTDAAGVIQKTLGTFSGEAAFAWSHDGEKIAYIASDRLIDTGLLGQLHVVNLATSEEIVQDRQVFAFFWSPNGQKIAYFVPYLDNATPEAGGEGNSTPTVLMQLNVLDVGTGENREQYTFQPTQDFLSVLTYFDQYHQSNTIWSPDNNNLVLSFIDNQGQPGIAVVAASGQLEPRILAQGFLAFWSWK